MKIIIKHFFYHFLLRPGLEEGSGLEPRPAVCFWMIFRRVFSLLFIVIHLELPQLFSNNNFVAVYAYRVRKKMIPRTPYPEFPIVLFTCRRKLRPYQK